ncbi:SRPBCC domain-containing protein [Pedobacter miscanthi]|uniref:SRPBCC domain-containing protein n=1 Tax=Pedobacter miscanthi TaxID=2259170 RepID=A0A366L5J4_9SPHI|nr:SRPBCC domain-containing protein [Pedobacter miscanthi]RBQ09147.1 SRPBCC domain-containing protein [Pedobacter miscanthi]
MERQTHYTTSILLDKSPEEVFNTINNVGGWWQGEINGSTGKVNDEFTYQMGDVHFSKQKVIESLPGKKVVWLVTDSEINFVSDKKEWVNTKIVFDISPEGEKTRLTFTHRGLVPAIECYGGCSGAWQNLIEKSLFSYINTGKGVDVF